MRELLKPIRQVLEPYLKAQGFRREGRDWRLDCGELIRYVTYHNQNRFGNLWTNPSLGFFSPELYATAGPNIIPAGPSCCQVVRFMSTLCGMGEVPKTWEFESVDQAEEAGRQMLEAYRAKSDEFWSLLKTTEDMIGLLEKEPRYYSWVAASRVRWEIAVWRRQIDPDKVPFSADWQERTSC